MFQKYFIRCALVMSVSVAVAGDHAETISILSQMLDQLGWHYAEKSLAAINATLQEHVFRKPDSGKERWEIGSQLSQEQGAAVWQAAQKLHFFNEWQPQKVSYRYAVLLGATAFRVRTRLNYLMHLWKTGTRFDELVFLTGARTLDPKVDGDALTEAERADAPKTETDMMRVVYAHTDVPEDMRAIPLTVIDAPATVLPDGKFRRPSTADTVNMWMAQNPKPGTVMFVSNAPYALYQEGVARELMPASWHIETVASAIEHEQETPEILLDTITRWVFQLVKLQRP